VSTASYSHIRKTDDPYGSAITAGQAQNKNRILKPSCVKILNQLTSVVINGLYERLIISSQTFNR
jgi:hypothetical protein